MLPWLPSILLIGLHFYRSGVRRLLQRLAASPRTRVTVLVVLLALATPHAGVLYDTATFGGFFGPDDRFPRIGRIEEPDYYYRFIDHLIWPTEPKKLLLLQMARIAMQPSALAFTALYVLLLAGLFERACAGARAQTR
jgi:hypothetical protein